MKTNELRIGNYLNGKRGHVVVSEIIRNNSVKIYDNTSSFYVGICLTPIEITKEWLLKLGFEYSNFYNNYKIKAGEYFNSVRYDDEDCEWCYNNDSSDAGCYYVTSIKYIHELQNLYFALNGEELNCKL
jgi:hypothetical protein